MNNEARTLSGPYKTLDKTVPAIIAAFIIILAVLGIFRQTSSYYAEDDLIFRHMPEAKRFLEGHPLELRYHPPAYAVSLAGLYVVVKDWLKAGILLSLITSGFFLYFAYNAVKQIFGLQEALGALAALLVSWIFISFSLFASNDMYFSCFYMGALYFISTAIGQQKSMLWLAGGICTGFAILSRMNGILALMFLLFIWVLPEKSQSWKKALAILMAGVMIPVTLWIVGSRVTDSPFFPASNYENLAITYFPVNGDRVSQDAVLAAQENFSGIKEVLLKDPPKIVLQYIRDVSKNTMYLFTKPEILPFPYIVLALPGFLLLFLENPNRFKYILLLNLAAMNLLLGMHVWQDRYYIFMLPFMGAGIVCLFKDSTFLKGRRMKPVLIVAVLAVSLVFFLITVRQGYKNDFQTSLTHDAKAAAKTFPGGEAAGDRLIIAHSAHLGYYSGSDFLFYPRVQTLSDLRNELKAINSSYLSRSLYLFYGRVERYLRPQLQELLRPDMNIRWLKQVSGGPESGGWVLYKVLKNEL